MRDLTKKQAELLYLVKEGNVYYQRGLGYIINGESGNDYAQGLKSLQEKLLIFNSTDDCRVGSYGLLEVTPFGIDVLQRSKWKKHPVLNIVGTQDEIDKLLKWKKEKSEKHKQKMLENSPILPKM